MSTIKFQKDSYTIPDSWNGMTAKQLELIAKIIITSIHPLWLMVKLALSFMGMRLSNKKAVYIDGEQFYYIRHSWRKVYLVNSLQMYEICKCIEYLLEDNKIASGLTRNPYPVIEWRFSRLFGPADCFANLRFGEFIQAEVERDLLAKTGNEHHFNRMMAILWRPTCWKPSDSDLRAPLRMDAVDKRARKISRLTSHQKKVMQWYYDGCLQFLKLNYSSVFSEGEATSSGSAFDSFMKMVNLLADNKLIDVDRIREAYLYDALYTLQEIINKHENR